NMKRNKLLSLSLYFFRFVQLCLVLLLVGGIILLVYYQVAPDQFSNYKFIPTEGKIEWLDLKRVAETKVVPGATVSMMDIQPVFIYLIYLQLLSLFVLFWLIIQEFKKVIRSLQQLQTFQNCNVEAFRKM